MQKRLEFRTVLEIYITPNPVVRKQYPQLSREGLKNGHIFNVDPVHMSIVDIEDLSLKKLVLWIFYIVSLSCSFLFEKPNLDGM